MGEGDEEKTPLQGTGCRAAARGPRGPCARASGSAGPAAVPGSVSYLESLFQALPGSDSLQLAGLGSEGGVQGPG